jgi:RNA polymerase sigma-70 factor (ECF subfamily)
VSLSDHDLLARALADDDRHAFGELVRRHQSVVRAFLRRLTGGQHAQADDLAQEAFLEAHRQLAKFRGDAAFGTWLLGIAYNRFRTARRRERPTEELTDEMGGMDGAAEPFTATEDLKHDVAHALGRLTPDERAAIHLCFGEGLSHQQAAEVLGSPLGTVKTHIFRAKDKLRVHLRAWAPT